MASFSMRKGIRWKGERWNYRKMHTSRGTRAFQSAPASIKKQWARYDSVKSRNIYRKKGWLV